MEQHIGYDDLSFILQALDNTGTIGEVDDRLVTFWAEEGKIAHANKDEAASYLFHDVVEVQLKGQLTQRGASRDRITIHKDTDSFVAQFFIDVRDEANRPATILCYGRMPRATSIDAIRRGLHLLRDFLGRQGIAWTPAIKERYLVVCRELAKTPEAGFHFSVPKLRLPSFLTPTDSTKVTDDEQIARQGPGASVKMGGTSPSAGQEIGSPHARRESDSAKKREGMSPDQPPLLSSEEEAKKAESQERTVQISTELGQVEQSDDGLFASGESSPPPDKQRTSSPDQEGQ